LTEIAATKSTFCRICEAHCPLLADIDRSGRVVKLQADINGRPITLEELQNMCFLLFLGGMDTVTNVTGFAYHQLAISPGLQERLASDPAAIPKFVDEALRCGLR
jgi:cytochrome P450